MVILGVLICIFNIVMWIVFLRNFKKLFTTEDVIESTKAQVNNILKNFDRDTERNLSLIDNACARLKALNAEAEKKIKLMNEMESRSLGVSELKTKVNSALGHSSSSSRKAVDAYTKEKSHTTRKSLKEDDSVMLTLSGENAVQDDQKTLFDEEPKHQKLDITVLEDGTSYKEIPVVTPQVFVPETPVQNFKKNEIRENIVKLFDQGYDMEIIAKELGCSSTEVQLALSIEGRI